MILDIIICVGLAALIIYLVYSIIQKVKARKADKKKENEIIDVTEIKYDNENPENK